MVFLENEMAFAFKDANPVGPGHCLVVPRRHVPDIFQLSNAEVQALFSLINQLREHLSNELSPNGFNVGVNIGRAAGQTVAHAHVHVIPRFEGDVSDPTGGVRNVIPGMGPY